MKQWEVDSWAQTAKRHSREEKDKAGDHVWNKEALGAKDSKINADFRDLLMVVPYVILHRHKRDVKPLEGDELESEELV